MWLAVILRIFIPFSVFNIPVEISLPVFSETAEFPEISVTERTTAELTAENTASISTALPDRKFSPIPPSEESAESIREKSGEFTTESLPEQTIRDATSPAVPGRETASENTASVRPARHLNLRGVFLTVWIIGAVVSAVWFAFSYLKFSLKIRKSRKYLSDYRKIRVFTSFEAGIPCLFGLIPSIYVLPESIRQSDYPLILKHEYIHFRHGDHLWGVLRIVILIFFWWNPLAWIAAILSKQDAELAADESVVSSLSEEDRVRYARSILDHSPVVRSPLEKAAVHFGGSPIKTRILAITERRNSHFGKLFSTAALLLVAASLIGSTFTVTVVGKVPETDLPVDVPEETTEDPASTTIPEETEAKTGKKEQTVFQLTAAKKPNKEALRLPSDAAAPDPTLVSTGKCGDCFWTLRKDGCMTISGEGLFADYYNYRLPWKILSDQITSVVVEEGVTMIGMYAFSGCVNLKEVTISSTVKIIDPGAFAYCYSLTKVTMADGGAVEIRESAFDSCYQLREVRFPSRLMVIGTNAFRETGIVDLDLPAELQRIEKAAFSGCSSLQTVKMKDNVTYLGESAFSDCTSLQSVVFSNTLKEVGDYAFCRSGISGNVKFPRSMQKLGRWVFEGCPNLKTYSVYVRGNASQPKNDRKTPVIDPYNPVAQMPSIFLYFPETDLFAQMQKSRQQNQFPILPPYQY